MIHRRRFLPVFLLALLLSLSACNDEDEPIAMGSALSKSSGFGGATMQAVAPTFAEGPAVANDAVAMERSIGSEATIMDRSKLGDRRVAETHSFAVELESSQIQARIMADYQTCLSLGCEIMGSNVQSKSNGYLNARIAPDKLATFFKAIESGLGEVKQHQVSLNDETTAYVDTSARLKNQIALRDRLTTLLHDEKTKSVSDVMQIERELTRVQQQIDSATAQMNALEKRTAMATVNISYDVPYFARADHYDRLKTSFARAWRSFVSNLDSVIVFIGTVLPWLPVILLGLWLGAKILRAGFSGGFKLLKRKN